MSNKTILRLCLKDKRSVLVEADMKDILSKVGPGKFIEVINHKTQKTELYSSDFIWCIRKSSQNETERQKQK